ncbi:MAG: hypothetical protein ACRDSP_25245 [Pseudonocardiaceae bacterium]
MTSFHPPINLPPATDRLMAKINKLHYRAHRVMDTPVTGPRGQQLTVAEAKYRAKVLGDAIDAEEADGSQRHRGVSRTTKALALGVVAIVDFPIMLWLVSSVFNVDWDNPFGINLAVSAVVSVLATGGAAAALYHLGHDQRQNKNHRRQLDRNQLTLGSKISIAAVTLLVGLIAAVMFVRVWTEGKLSGVAGLAGILALLVSAVMLISAWLVFWIAFRDGSPEQDDLAQYTRLVQRHLRIKRGYEDSAQVLQDQVELISVSAARSYPQHSGGYLAGYRALAPDAIPTVATRPAMVTSQTGDTADPEHE